MRKIPVVLFAASAALMIVTTAALSAPLAPEVIAAIRWVNDPRISPDGRTVIFTLEEPRDPAAEDQTAVSHLWRVPADGSSAPFQLTWGETGESSPRWSPDGQRIAFLAARGSKEPKAQVWWMRADGGEARPLTKAASDVLAFAWSMDGGTIAFIAADAESSAAESDRRAKRDWVEVERHRRPNRLWWVDVASGRADSLPGSASCFDLAWSPDGRTLAAIEASSSRVDDRYWKSRLVLVDGAAKTVQRIHDEATAGPLRFSPDGQSLFAYPMTGSVAINWPAVFSVSGGEPRWLGRSFKGTFAGGHWTADGRGLILTAFVGLKAHLAYYDLDSDQVTLLSEMPTEGGRSVTVSLDGQGKRVAFLAESWDRPAEVWTADLSDGGKKVDEKSLRKLTDLNPHVGGAALGTIEALQWIGAEGQSIEGLLIKPHGFREGIRYPLVVQVHGGPEWQWWYGWHGSWHEWGQLLASHGFMILLPNPRGSDGYGFEFIEGNYADWGGKDFQDIEAGVDALIQKGWADPDRLGYGGWSYGGHMTAWTVGHTTRYKAAVVGAGVVNLSSFHGTTDITPSFLTWYFGKSPTLDPQKAAAHSPISYASRIKTPVLIVHGEADVRVPVTQGDELFHALRETGCPVEYVRYPREPHDFKETAHRQDLLRRVLGFYEKHLSARSLSE